MDATTVAVDLAKDIFEVALANRGGRILERKRLTRRQFERLIKGLAPGTEVVMVPNPDAPVKVPYTLFKQAFAVPDQDRDVVRGELAELLAAVRQEPGEARERARALMLDVFRLLGDDHPLTVRYRRDLTRALF